jgi:hypothetical protein
MKGWHVREMLLKSVDQNTGVVQGTRFKNRMFGGSGMRRDAMEAIYTKDEIKALENNAITLGVIQAKQGGGAGGMLIQLAQAGAIAGIATGQFERASLGVLIAPEVVARILTSAKANKWLLSQHQIGKKGVLVGSTALRLSNLARKFEDQIGKEREELSK